MEYPEKLEKETFEIYLKERGMKPEQFQPLGIRICSIENCKNEAIKMIDDGFKDAYRHYEPFLICKYHYEMLGKNNEN